VQNNMLRVAGEWRHGGAFQGGALRAKVIFHHRCRAGKLLGARKIFSRISPNLHEKFFCATFAYKVSPTKIMKSFFWCDLQKSSSCVFLQTLVDIFLSQATLDDIFTQISNKSKRLGVRFHALHPHLQQKCFS